MTAKPEYDLGEALSEDIIDLLCGKDLSAGILALRFALAVQICAHPKCKTPLDAIAALAEVFEHSAARIPAIFDMVKQATRAVPTEQWQAEQAAKQANPPT
jgi:hypothetical protein